MEMRKRCQSKDNCSQIKTDKYYKDRINFLLNEIEIKEYKKEDIPIMIILFLSKKNFKASPPEDIIKYICNQDLFPSLSLLINPKDDIMNALKSNKIVKFHKKKVKLDLEKSLNCLESYCQKNIKKKSSNSKKIPANVIDFPLSESDDEYASCCNQINMAFSFGKNKDDTDNTINNGEYCQIKVNKKRKSNLNNLSGENEKDKEDIFDREGLSKMIGGIILGENKCFQNIKKVVSDFFIYYENINQDKENTQIFDGRIKKINELFFEMNTKTNLFNELSECFDDVKKQLIDCNHMIKREMNSMRIICEKNFFTMDQYAGTKQMYLSYKDMSKKLFNKLKENFSEAGKLHKKIRIIKLNIKNELKSISEEFKSAENVDKFRNLINDSINTTHHLLVIDNMGETLNIFNSSVVEIEKSFAEIEEISEKKKSKK